MFDWDSDLMSCKVVECISSEVGVCRTSTKGRLTKQDLCGLLVIPDIIKRDQHETVR